MTFLLSMPGGSEWIIVGVMGLLFIVSPILAFMYYQKNKDLKKQLDAVTKERNDLMNNMIV